MRGKIVETEEISSYAAVALAGLGGLPIRSLVARSSFGCAAGSTPRKSTRSAAASTPRKARACAGALSGWAAGIVDEASQARPEMPAGVEDRAADMWEPLIALADIAGGQWPNRAREAAVALVAVAREVEPSLNLRLLADLRTVFGKRDDHEALYTKTILSDLHTLEGAPWADLKGKPLSDNQLARRLRNYDVKPTDVRIDKVVLKGYRRADLHDPWARYLGPLSEEGATARYKGNRPAFSGRWA